jgi:phosphoserine phosphatase
MLGTGLETKGATYTGRVIDAVCFGEHRVSRIKDYIKKNGLEVDFAKSYAYGDMKWDYPVLELVGNPVAVYPDADLRAYARSKDWKIIS